MKKALLVIVGLLLVTVGPAWGTTFNFNVSNQPTDGSKLVQ